MLDAAFELLVERGYVGCTTSAIAERAGASKETLYSWFGDKAGLFAALIERQADATNARVRVALAGGGDMRATLTDFAVHLLRLLLSERALALNRAAIAEQSTAPELAERLLLHGRHRTGPLVESYLARQAARGHLRIEDPAEAFRVLYGLIVQDTQIRVLLGEPAPLPEAMAARAAAAVDDFLTVFAATRPGVGRGQPSAAEPDTRWVLFDTDALAELARDGTLLEAVIQGAEEGRLRVLLTYEQAEELEQGRGDMACAAQAELERLPTTVLAGSLPHTGHHNLTLVAEDPVAETDVAHAAPDVVWTLSDLRQHLGC